MDKEQPQSYKGKMVLYFKTMDEDPYFEILNLILGSSIILSLIFVK